MVIPLFSSLIYVMDLRSSVLKAYRKVAAVLGEAYTTHGAELYGERVYHQSKPLTLQRIRTCDVRASGPGSHQASVPDRD